MDYLHKKPIFSYLLKNLTFLFLVFLCFSFPSFGQEKNEYISLSYIVEKLEFKSHNGISNNQINKSLIVEIKKRKVNFLLTAKDEESIKNLQGSDLLIKAIRENLPKNIKEKLIFYEKVEALYIKFLSHRKGHELSKYKIAIKTGEELIEWYEDDKKIKEQFREEFRKDFKEIIEYVRKQLIIIKATIECYI